MYLEELYLAKEYIVVYDELPPKAFLDRLGKRFKLAGGIGPKPTTTSIT
jgi:hypothetical protein